MVDLPLAQPLPVPRDPTGLHDLDHDRDRDHHHELDHELEDELVAVSVEEAVLVVVPRDLPLQFDPSFLGSLRIVEGADQLVGVDGPFYRCGKSF